VRPTLNALDRRLESRGTAAGDGGRNDTGGGDDVDAGPDGSLELNTANALWGQRGYPWSDAYLDVLARHYGAGLRTVDFRADPDAVRRRIDAWVAGQTDERITDLLPQGISPV
jgi:serpin B